MKRIKRAWRALKKPSRPREVDIPDSNGETTPTHHPNSLDGSGDRDSRSEIWRSYVQQDVADTAADRFEGSLVHQDSGTPVQSSEQDSYVGNFVQQDVEEEDSSPYPNASVPSSGSSDSGDIGVTHLSSSTGFFLPQHTTGSGTHSYERALANRISFDRFESNGDLNIKRHRPIFLHDTMMLPGSLANLIGEGTGTDILDRLTPGILRGFHTYVHDTTGNPMLIQTPNPNYSVHGILLFGCGKRARRCIDQHYRPHAQRIVADVQFEVQVPLLREERQDPNNRWGLERRTAGAHVYLWTDVASADASVAQTDAVGWRLGDLRQGSDDEEIDIVPAHDPSWQLSRTPMRIKGKERARPKAKRQSDTGEHGWTDSPEFERVKTGPPDFAGW